MNRRTKQLVALTMGAFLSVQPLLPASAGLFDGIVNTVIKKGRQKGEEAAYAEIGNALGAKAPVHLDQKKQSFKKVEEPKDFHPTRLALHSLADLDKPLPPGDYSLDVMSFCTQWSIHIPGHNAPYTLGRGDGSRIGMITAFLVKGQAAGLTPDQLHNISWDIEGGAPLSQWKEEDRAIIHRIIPNFEGQLQGDLYDQFKAEYGNEKAHIPFNLPSFEEFVAKVPAGKQYMQLRQAQTILTNRSIASQEVGDRLYDATAEKDGLPQRLPDYTGKKKSSWNEIQPGVYGRYTVQHARAGGGSDGINLLELRVTKEAASAAFPREGIKVTMNKEVKVSQAVIPIPGPGMVITLGALLYAMHHSKAHPMDIALDHDYDKAKPVVAFPQERTQTTVTVAVIKGNGGGNKKDDDCTPDPVDANPKKGPIPDKQPENLQEQQLLNSARSGRGEQIQSDLGDIPRLVANYGGNPQDWVKLGTPPGEGIKLHGHSITVHWFHNLRTGQNVEFKFKRDFCK